MYISASDLAVPEDVLIRLTDDESTGSVNTDRVDDAISSAQAVVDASLSRQYQAPLADPPQLVKKLTADIALYNLYLRQAMVPGGGKGLVREGARNAGPACGRRCHVAFCGIPAVILRLPEGVQPGHDGGLLMKPEI